MADDGARTVTRPLRVVFICTQNKLRSPTAEAVFRSLDGWDVTSAGTNRDAETPVSRDLLEWADVAVCMEKRHRDVLRQQFSGALPDDRIVTLGGECSVSVAPFAALARRHGDDQAILWIDSHPDVDTSDTGRRARRLDTAITLLRLVLYNDSLL